MKVLILGASGFLGKSITGEFSERPFEVFTASRKRAADADERRHFQVDIGEPESLRRIERLQSVDIVIHAAGLAHRFDRTAAEAFRRVNADGTRNAANLAVKLQSRHFVYISTVAVYGNSNPDEPDSSPVTEDVECRPTGEYAASKYAGEAAARRICGGHDMRLTVLRPATIVGEGDPGNLMRLIRLVDKNRFIWVGAGDNLKTLVYKTDVARAVRLAATVAAPGANSLKIYNVAAKPIQMREIVAEIADALGKRIPKVSIPDKFAVETLKTAARLSGSIKLKRLSETVQKWISDENFSGAKMRDELGFEPLVGGREAVGREANFYKSAERGLFK